MAEAHSELAYVQQEMDTTKEELTGMQQELREAKSEMVESQTRISKLCKKMDQQKNDFQVEHLQEELCKRLKNLGKERRQWHAMLTQQPNS